MHLFDASRLNGGILGDLPGVCPGLFYTNWFPESRKEEYAEMPKLRFIALWGRRLQWALILA